MLGELFALDNDNLRKRKLHISGENSFSGGGGENRAAAGIERAGLKHSPEKKNYGSTSSERVDNHAAE